MLSWAKLRYICYVRLVVREQSGRLVDGGIVVDGVGEVGRKGPIAGVS